jgi:6,7-dimethyl-8-ribityllumazine synthase
MTANAMVTRVRWSAGESRWSQRRIAGHYRLSALRVTYHLYSVRSFVIVSNTQAPPRVAIIVSRFNASITDALLAGARSEYAARCEGDAPDVYRAAGAFELPGLCLAAAETGRYQGIVALGCLIRGETRHDRYIADAVAHGLVQATLKTGVPIAFGVLTVESGKQARARSGGDKGNKGADAMNAVLDAIAELSAIRSGAASTMSAQGSPDKAATGVGANS